MSTVQEEKDKIKKQIQDGANALIVLRKNVLEFIEYGTDARTTGLASALTDYYHSSLIHYGGERALLQNQKANDIMYFNLDESKHDAIPDVSFPSGTRFMFQAKDDNGNAVVIDPSNLYLTRQITNDLLVSSEDITAFIFPVIGNSDKSISNTLFNLSIKEFSFYKPSQPIQSVTVGKVTLVNVPNHGLTGVPVAVRFQEGLLNDGNPSLLSGAEGFVSKINGDLLSVRIDTSSETGSYTNLGNLLFPEILPLSCQFEIKQPDLKTGLLQFKLKITGGIEPYVFSIDLNSGEALFNTLEGEYTFLSNGTKSIEINIADDSGQTLQILTSHGFFFYGNPVTLSLYPSLNSDSIALESTITSDQFYSLKIKEKVSGGLNRNMISWTDNQSNSLDTQDFEFNYNPVEFGLILSHQVQDVEPVYDQLYFTSSEAGGYDFIDLLTSVTASPKLLTNVIARDRTSHEKSANLIVMAEGLHVNTLWIFESDDPKDFLSMPDTDFRNLLGDFVFTGDDIEKGAFNTSSTAKEAGQYVHINDNPFYPATQGNYTGDFIFIESFIFFLESVLQYSIHNDLKITYSVKPSDLLGGNPYSDSNFSHVFETHPVLTSLTNGEIYTFLVNFLSVFDSRKRPSKVHQGITFTANNLEDIFVFPQNYVLQFNGTNTIQVVVNTWNTANPTKPITIGIENDITNVISGSVDGNNYKPSAVFLEFTDSNRAIPHEGIIYTIGGGFFSGTKFMVFDGVFTANQAITNFNTANPSNPVSAAPIGANTVVLPTFTLSFNYLDASQKIKTIPSDNGTYQYFTHSVDKFVYQRKLSDNTTRYFPCFYNNMLRIWNDMGYSNPDHIKTQSQALADHDTGYVDTIDPSQNALNLTFRSESQGFVDSIQPFITYFQPFINNDNLILSGTRTVIDTTFYQQRNAAIAHYPKLTNRLTHLNLLIGSPSPNLSFGRSYLLYKTINFMISKKLGYLKKISKEFLTLEDIYTSIEDYQESYKQF